MAQKKKNKTIRRKNTPGSTGVRANKKTLDRGEGFSRTQSIFAGLVFICLAVCAVGFYPTPYTFSKSVAIPFTTTQKDSGDLELGDSKVSIEGSEGSNDQGYLRGVVDDARIYSRALLSSDVASIAAEGRPEVVVPAVQPSPSAQTVPGAPNTGAQPAVSSVNGIITGGFLVGIVALLYYLHRRSSQ